MPKDWGLDKINEANLHVALEGRSRGLSEITGRPGEVIHHILGRNKPQGFKNLPLAIQEVWPHVEFLCIVLTRGEHQGAHKYSKMMKVLLLNLLLLHYGDRVWEGKTYREWLNEEPFRRWL